MVMSAIPKSAMRGGERPHGRSPGARSSRVSDIDAARVVRAVPLLPPVQMRQELPLGRRAALVARTARAEVVDILNRTDDRLLTVVGPCSMHDPRALLDYAARLIAEAAEVRNDLHVVIRAYPAKPRTKTGWTGLINDPYLNGSGEINTGLRMARTLLRELLDIGLPVGCEFVDPVTLPYIADTIVWGAIGARTVESQLHRQLASGLAMPIGFKNRRDGDIVAAVNAVLVAAVPHAFAALDADGAPAALHTRGNADCHVVLRGGTVGPNHRPPHVANAIGLLRAAGLPERLVIDASHGNSGKDHRRQAIVLSEIAEQVGGGNSAIVGVMLESFLVEGRQDLRPGRRLKYGQSITDACIGWEATVDALRCLAAAVRRRRKVSVDDVNARANGSAPGGALAGGPSLRRTRSRDGGPVRATPPQAAHACTAPSS
jgi:3-deoxy-7-phosphoheptulonate synthase